MPASSTVPLPPAVSGGTILNNNLSASGTLLPPNPGTAIDSSNAVALVKTVANIAELRDRYMQNDINSSLPNEDWNALTYFVAENDLQSVTKLILSGASTDTTGGGRTLTGTGHTPLHVAARYGSVECMECLIRGRVNRPRRDFGSDMEVQMEAEMLMTKTENIGCDINSLDNFSFTPLHYAACSGYIDGVDKLLRLGADVMKAGGRSGNVKARDVAEQRGHLDIVDLLSRWERKKADPINDAFRNWLASLDAEMYAQPFIDAGYDMEYIRAKGLTDEDLDCVGVSKSKLGLRGKLKNLWGMPEAGGDNENDEDDEDDEDDDESGSDEDESGSDEDGSDEDDSEKDESEDESDEDSDEE